jgi:NADPH:quinone reductase-like Zn-dependent oxidoreductase
LQNSHEKRDRSDGQQDVKRPAMKAIQIEAFGNPAEVVKVVDVPDVGAPAAGEVVIALEASPINPSNLFLITGGYGYRPRLPAIMGTEGVGRVVAVGAGVKHLREGDRTLVPFPGPAWAERFKTTRSGKRSQKRHKAVARSCSRRNRDSAGMFNTHQ